MLQQEYVCRAASGSAALPTSVATMTEGRFIKGGVTSSVMTHLILIRTTYGPRPGHYFSDHSTINPERFYPQEIRPATESTGLRFRPLVSILVIPVHAVASRL